jgi:hypothetical protein
MRIAYIIIVAKLVTIKPSIMRSKDNSNKTFVQF